jgi:hypothetical protein
MKSKLLLLSAFTFCLNAFAQIPTSGLVGRYSFNGNANDQSGNSNNGTFINGTAYANDRFGNANSSASLDGVDDYISLPTGSLTTLNITGDFSVSFWIKTSDVSGLLASIGDNVNINSGGYLSGINANNVGNGKIASGTRGAWVGSVNTVTNNAWRNITYVLQGNTIKLYIDNIFESQSTSILSPLSWNGNRVIGCRNDLSMGASSNYGGLFDDLLIYNRAITLTEVGQIFSTSCTNPNVTSGLVARYDFSGNANDGSGNSNNGVVNGATLTSDRFGNLNSAYLFNGTNSYIDVPHSTSFTFTSNIISVSYWAKFSSFQSAGDVAFILCKQSSFGASQSGFNIYQVDNSENGIRVSNTSAASSATLNFSTINQFHNFLYVYDNGNSYSYMDGVLTNSLTGQTGIIGANTNNLYIGKPSFIYPNSFPFSGVLDEIKIYNRALSSCDADSIFNIPNPLATIISEYNLNSTFSLYPNPANDKVSIEINSTLNQNLVIEILDLTSRLMQKQSEIVNIGNNKLEVNLSNLSSGLYLIKCNNSIQKIQITK